MHVYEVTPGIYKFFSLNFFFWNLKHCTVYFKNSKMKLFTSVEWLYFLTSLGCFFLKILYSRGLGFNPKIFKKTLKLSYNLLFKNMYHTMIYFLPQIGLTPGSNMKSYNMKYLDNTSLFCHCHIFLFKNWIV